MINIKTNFKDEFLVFLSETLISRSDEIIQVFKEVGFDAEFIEQSIFELIKEGKVKITRTSSGIEQINLIK